MFKPQPSHVASQPPSQPRSAPAAIEFGPRPPRPPKTSDATSDHAAILAWLKTSMSTIYLAAARSPYQDGPPKPTRGAYLDIYSATLDYSVGAIHYRRGYKVPYFDPLYSCLQETIKTHCIGTRADVFVPGNSSGVDGARRLIGEYVAH